MIPNLPQREEYLRKKRKRKILKYVLVFLLITIIFGVSIYISHRPEIRISKVILNGGILVTESDIQSEALKYMSGSYIWLYPKNNSLWYPKKSLEKYLKESFKRIDIIDIKREGFESIVVEITEKKPFAIWCAGIPEEVRLSESEGSIEINTSKCYFLDQDSSIFSESPYFSGNAYFKYYGLIATSSPIGSYYIASSTQFEEISSFVNLVKDMSIQPIYLIAKSESDFSLVVAGGGQIYFDTKKPLTEIAENLRSLLRTPSLSTTTNSDLPVEYIDLRYGNKLFYKLRGE